MEYKIFVKDELDENICFKAKAYEIQDGCLKIFNGRVYDKTKKDWNDEEFNAVYPLHRVLVIDYME